MKPHFWILLGATAFFLWYTGTAIELTDMIKTVETETLTASRYCVAFLKALGLYLSAAVLIIGHAVLKRNNAPNNSAERAGTGQPI